LRCLYDFIVSSPHLFLPCCWKGAYNQLHLPQSCRVHL
jgi:hypothetical protein